ncbi:MAG: hypothetical protein ABIR59_00625 [Gemmatimonadales bacterium]
MTPRLAAVALSCAGALAALPLSAQTMRSFTAARGILAERQIIATLDFGAGTVQIGPAAASQLYRMEVRYDADRFQPTQQYDPRTGILKLGLESIGKSGMRVTSRSQLEQVGDFVFSRTVPLSLSANLGASDANLELGGLTLTDLTVRSGASRATVAFGTPTRGECRHATFTVGAGDIDITGLANAGCREVRLDGGIGRATLDFAGAWKQDARVTVEMSMGVVTLRIPRGIGVRLDASRFLSTLSADGFERDGKTWITPRFDAAKRKITVGLNTTVASIDVVWID